MWNFEKKEERVEYMQQELVRAGFLLDEQKIDQLEQYYQMLVEKNKVMNLTAITEFSEVVQKHFIDSLMLLQFVDLKQCSVMDVGTGAGFPGIPLKIACPEATIILLDSLNKRIKFLNEVIETLGLKKIKAIHGRAEDLAQDPEYREQCDFCVSRAVANLSTLSEYGMPFVKVGGFFIPYKSGEIEEELKQAEKAIAVLGGNFSVEKDRKNIKTFQLPESDIRRSLIFINKKRTTAKKYPRKAGMPSKDPLK